MAGAADRKFGALCSYPHQFRRDLPEKLENRPSGHE